MVDRSPGRKPSLEQRIAEKDEWTFKECLGLAAEYHTKPRFVIVKVMAMGKRYKDTDAG